MELYSKLVIIINLWSCVRDYLIDAFKNILKHSVHFYDFFTSFRFLWFLDINIFLFLHNHLLQSKNNTIE